MAAPDPGTPFPSITLRDERGRPTAPHSGETLYGFFKTTCPVCELAWPYLDRIRELAAGGGLSVLAVSQDDPEATARFNRRIGVQVETLFDPDPWPASDALGLTDVPTFFLVDGGRVIRESVVGFQRLKMEEFARRAAEAAGKPAPALFPAGEEVPAFKPG